MKKNFLFSILIGIALTTDAQIKMPAPSPTQTITQDFGLSSIVLKYSRPSLRGRKMIGAQVPWNVLWRTGANTATEIRFNGPVEIFGHRVDTGTYAIYTIPEKSGEWTFVLNKGFKNWGINSYDQNEDVFRQKVKVSESSNKVETLTMQFSDITPENCVLNIRWENFGIKVPIVSHFKDELRKQFEAALASSSQKKPYFQAAEFYNEYDNNKPRALEMVNEAIAQSPNPAFYVVYYKAKIQQEMGDKKDALVTARQALEISKKSNADNYVILSEYLIKQLK